MKPVASNAAQGSFRQRGGAGSPPPENIRNIAIIAHVDHGKTTLVDHLLRQSGTFSAHEQLEERYMDSMALERERGITIAAKNASFLYEGVKVNIVDTPGHSDFGGEVERILDMVDGAILLVDASEGPLPQTRFVLQKALAQDLKIIVCINKIDRPDARVNEVLDQLLEMFIDLDAADEQAEFDAIYTIAREGQATLALETPGTDLQPLFEWMLTKIPAPVVAPEEPLQMLVSNIDYSDYVGRLAIGRIRAGMLRVGDEIVVAHREGQKRHKIRALYSYQGGTQVPEEALGAGDIAVVAGIPAIEIGDTLTSVEKPCPLPRIQVDAPTVGIVLSVNDGPLAGRDRGKVTSRTIKERLERELLRNVSLQVEPEVQGESWRVLGRGELQLCILLEQMRREGFEFLASMPRVLLCSENGNTLEPLEAALIDVEERYMGAVTSTLGERKGLLHALTGQGTGRVRMEFHIPARGLIGYRSRFLTDTRGSGLLHTRSLGYGPHRGPFPQRSTGALVADRPGRATAYALHRLEERGRLFIGANTEVYAGMVVGEYNKGEVLHVNVTRQKQLTNIRASGTDEALRLSPVKPPGLEEALEWIGEEEWIEVTPAHIRIRRRVLSPHSKS